MTFFDDEPPFPEPELPTRRARERWERPDFTLPGTVPGHFLLLRTDTVAVSLGNFRAYPTGFEFTLHTRKRPTEEVRHRRGHYEVLDPFAWEQHGESAESRFRLGLLYADGRRAFGQFWPHDRDQDSDAIVIWGGGGGGDDHTWDGAYWVHPLPPAGPLVFVATWPAHGVGEVRAELDATAMHLAAAEAVELWPEEHELTDVRGTTTGFTVTVVKDDEDDEADSAS